MKTFIATKRRALPLIVAACAMTPWTLSAADKKWDGGNTGGNQWDTASNWSDNALAADGLSGTAPTAGDDVIFDTSLRDPIAAIIGLGGSNAAANSITFGSLAGTPLGAFTLRAQTSGTTGRALTIASGNVTVHSSVTGTQTFGNASNGTMTLDTTSDFTFTNNSTTQALNVTAAFAAGKSLTMNTAGGAISLDIQRSAPTFAWLESAAANTSILNNASTGTLIVTLNGTGSHSFAGTINDGSAAGKVSLTVNNAALVQTLSGNSNYSGATIVTAGQLNINSATAIGNSTITLGGAIDNTSNADITLSTNNAINLINSTVTFGGTKNLNFGTGAVTWSQNNQTINLNGTNTNIVFGGVVTNSHNSGNEGLVINGAGNALTIGGFTSANRTTSTKNLLVSGTGNLTIAGALTDGTNPFGVAIANNGTGTILLSGSNSYTGTTSVNSGTIQAVNAAALPGFTVSGSVIVSSGATLAVNAGLASLWSASQIQTLLSNANFKVSSSIFAIDTGSGKFAYGNDITTNLSLAKLGSGTLTLTGNNTFGGTILIKEGRLAVGFGPAAGTLGVGTQGITNDGMLEINRSDAFTVARPISGTGGFEQRGLGTTTLTNTNTYTGSTTVRNGILKLDNGGSLGNANILLDGGTFTAGTSSGGGTLNYRIVDSVADRITIDGGVLELTNLKLIVAASGTTPLTGTAEYVLADKGVGDPSVLGSAFLSVVLPGSDWWIDYDGTARNPNSIVVAVPEPTGLTLIGLAAAGLLARKRRSS